MSTGNTRLLERLLADGLITLEAQEAALNLIARTGERVEEVILELKALDDWITTSSAIGAGATATE